MSDLLTPDQMAARIAELERQLAARSTQTPLADRSGAAASSGGRAAAGASSQGESESINVSGTVMGSIYAIYQSASGPAKLSDKEFGRILNEYLTWVMREHDQARLYAIERQPLAPLSLAMVYTSLKVARHRATPPSPSADRRGRAAPPQVSAQEGEWANAAQAGKDDTLDMADLLILRNRVAIIGGAGSGKTTYLSFVARSLAAALGGQTIDARLKPRRAGAALPIPIVVPLRYWKVYRDDCAAERSTYISRPEKDRLDDFIIYYLRHRYANIDASRDFFIRLLKGGGCLVMLDGLDEVVSISERAVVRDALYQFLNVDYPNNLCLVTCRPAGEHDAPFANDFERCTIQPMTPEQIKQLVDDWCGQIWEQPDDRAAACQTVVEAITELNQERAERKQEPLVATPLMVTMVVSVRYNSRDLPRERAKLFDAFVRVVLASQHTGAENERSAKEDLKNFGGSPDQQREMMSILAFGMHVAGQGATTDEGRVRAILEGPLKRRGEEKLLDEFLRAARHRGGLFEPHGDQFTFIHLTFQEFLAGQYLAQQWADLPDDSPSLAVIVADSWWREVVLLAIGSLEIPPMLYDKREAFITALCQMADPAQAQVAAAELAATGVLEYHDPHPMLENMARDRLVALLTDPGLGDVRAPTRAAAGRALAHLGDPRRGVLCTPLLQLGEGQGVRANLPDILWCPVPAEPFIMGEERDRHRETIAEPYLISRYLVTNAQYQAFVDDEAGYRNRQWWTSAGRSWRKDRRDPWRPGGVFEQANHPLVGVTWYEALAFCNWLDDRLHQQDNVFNVWQESRRVIVPCRLETKGWRVRLPTESEWERAARGTDGRTYPWGEEITLQHANYAEAEIGSTSAVGVFPRGASLCGALDMAGNVWEWCGTKWRETYKTREDNSPDGDTRRVLRGGSFYSQYHARCAFRGRLNPGSINNNFGLRVVVASVPPLGSGFSGL